MKYNIDFDYIKIVDSILSNQEFNKLKDIEHHGITRYDHCVKVSYYSYKIAKRLKLDYKSAARGGLMHDFFLSDDDRNIKEKLASTFTHPKLAVAKADSEFDICEVEKDIIRTHMFPINLAVPKYAESWLVSCVDKMVAVREFSHKFSYKLKYALNLYILFLINFVK